MLMLLFKLLHFPVSLGFSISIVGIVMSTILFAVLFLLVLLRNLIQLHKSKPVELRSSSVGEREPKVKWLLALVGAATLVAGYVMANTIQSPLQALTRFFFAVVLVIIGTYCIFTAGSIAVLKLLRANKHYYYKPQHFTTVSGLLYRMKQNAVGLASICILSTMLLVTVSTTVCLYLGVETSLKEVDAGVVEAAQSMGASTLQIVWKVYLPEAKPSLILGGAISLVTILAYTAIAGTVGAGGLGDIAVRYGHQRGITSVMWVTVVFLIILVQVVQLIFNWLSRRIDKRLDQPSGAKKSGPLDLLPRFAHTK